MADNDTPARGNDDVAAEVARLKREIANLKAALGERADDIAQGAARAAEAVARSEMIDGSRPAGGA